MLHDCLSNLNRSLNRLAFSACGICLHGWVLYPNIALAAGFA